VGVDHDGEPDRRVPRAAGGGTHVLRDRGGWVIHVSSQSGHFGGAGRTEQNFVSYSQERGHRSDPGHRVRPLVRRNPRESHLPRSDRHAIALCAKRELSVSRREGVGSDLPAQAPRRTRSARRRDRENSFHPVPTPATVARHRAGRPSPGAQNSLASVGSRRASCSMGRWQRMNFPGSISRSIGSTVSHVPSERRR